MMVLAFVAAVLVLLLALRARRRLARANLHAGLVAERPQYMTEPPRRSHRSVREERL